VRSNLVAGIEPKKRTLEGLEYLAAEGVVGTSDVPLHRGALPVFLLLSAGTGVAVGVLALALPLYALALSATPSEVGLIRAASGVGMLLSVIPAGFLVDRFGAQAMFHVGSVAVILCVIGYRFAPGPLALVGVALFEGAFRSLEFNALTATFLQALPRFGMKTVGWHKGALSLGLSFVGPLLGGALLGGLNFHAVFGVVAVLRPGSAHGQAGAGLRYG